MGNDEVNKHVKSTLFVKYITIASPIAIQLQGGQKDLKTTCNYLLQFIKKAVVSLLYRQPESGRGLYATQIRFKDVLAPRRARTKLQVY